MKKLKIQYEYIPKLTFFLAIVPLIYLVLISIIHIVVYVIKSDYNFHFYSFIAGAVLGIAGGLALMKSQPAPLLTITYDSMVMNLRKPRVMGSVNWNEISNVGIGLSFLELKSFNNPDLVQHIDLGSIKYNDLKDVKMIIIEICESKGIPFQNIT